MEHSVGPVTRLGRPRHNVESRLQPFHSQGLNAGAICWLDCEIVLSLPPSCTSPGGSFHSGILVFLAFLLLRAGSWASTAFSASPQSKRALARVSANGADFPARISHRAFLLLLMDQFRIRLSTPELGSLHDGGRPAGFSPIGVASFLASSPAVSC